MLSTITISPTIELFFMIDSVTDLIAIIYNYIFVLIFIIQVFKI